MKITVSVITICRNAEDIIVPTIESVLKQTYPHLEYTIVDGLSSDKTVEKAKATARLFPERSVQVFSERDNGIADAMNKGVRLSTGQIIAHLHAGDRYVDNRVIEKVIESYSVSSWRWAVASSVVVDAAGRPGHVYHPHPDCGTLLKKNCIPHQSTFLVRDIFTRHGLFRVDLKQAMDYEFWLRITFKGGERYQVLPFTTTYFLEGGRSAHTLELLRCLAQLRRELRASLRGLTWMDDAVFLARVAAFAAYACLRSRLAAIRSTNSRTQSQVNREF